MSEMNVTTTQDVKEAVPQHWLGKRKKKFVLPDGTELTEEELKQFDERRWWEAPKKKGKLGQNRKGKK